jgi:hypothetical protein
VDDPARLLARLDALTPREERFLREHCLSGLRVPELAARFGISEPAAALHLVRAASAFAGLSSMEDAREVAAANELALRGRLPEPLAAPLAGLRAQAAQVSALTEARYEARERRARPLRWIAAGILVALAWLLSRSS